MAKQLDNTLTAFSRRATIYAVVVLAGVVLICLIVGLAIAISLQNWPFAGIFLISILGLLVSIFLNFSRTRKLVGWKNQRLIDWEPALPDVQRQNLNLEVAEISKVLEVEPDQIGDLQSAYIVAEDLALRQIQQEENVPIMRHVSIGTVPFDAVLVKEDVVNCIEVSFLVAPDIRQEKVDAMMRKIGLAKRAIGDAAIGMQIRLMMVLVMQLTPEDEKQLRSVLNTQRFSNTPVDIDIRLLDFEVLQRIYVTE